MQKIFIESRREINKGKHQRIIVQDHKGLVWEMVSAEPFPPDKDILNDFRKNKKTYFKPHYYSR